LSFVLNLTSGATIILVAAAGFLGTVLWEYLKPRPSPASAAGNGNIL
jgi:hypothetical protein